MARRKPQPRLPKLVSPKAAAVWARPAPMRALRRVLLCMDYIKREFPEPSTTIGANVVYERMHQRLLVNHEIRQRRATQTRAADSSTVRNEFVVDLDEPSWCTRP